MSKINNGGPAFPVAVPTEFQFAEAGMTLRDWFAANVDGLSEDASPEYCESLVGRPLPEGFAHDAMQWWAEADAAFRYLKADAMLAERAKGGDA